MLRALSTLESFYIEHDIVILTISDLVGRVNPLLLQKAIETVVMMHPLLSSEVRASQEGDEFHQRESYEDKITVIGEVDKEKRKQIILSELNKPLAKTSLVRFTLLLEERIGILKSQNISMIMTTHHAVSDGISCVALHEQIWKTYAEMADNQSPSLTAHPLMPAVEELMPNHFTEAELADYIERYMQTAKHYHPYTLKTAEKGDEDIEMKYLTKKFTKKQTKALLDLCHQQNVSVHGAISAAHVLALRHMAGTDDALDVSCHSPINIRPVLKPALGNNDLFSAAIGCTHYQTVTADMSIETISEAVSKTISNHIESGDIFKSLLTFKETRLKMFLATSIGISNVGIVNLPPLSGKLKLVSLNFMARFPFPALTAYVTTSGNRLTILYPYAKPFYSTSTVSKLAGLAVEYLT